MSNSRAASAMRGAESGRSGRPGHAPEGWGTSERWLTAPAPLQRVADHGRPVVAGGLGRQQQAVGEHRGSQRLDVVGERVVAALERGERLGGPEQHQAGPRAGAELDARVVAGGVEERDDVAAQRLAAVHRGHGRLRGQHLADAGDRLEVQHAVAVGVLGQHVLLVLHATGSRATPAP